VYEALLAQKIERAVNRDWRRPRAAQRKPVDQLIGAKRRVARQQRFQNAQADGRKPFLARGADLFGMGNGVAGATVMIMTGRRKNRVGVDFLWQNPIHLPTQV
jgi:hypothetical protein